MPDTLSLRAAAAMGRLSALLLRPGDVFMGAIPEAERFGYARGSLSCTVFMEAYLNALPSPVITENETHRIVRIGGAR